MDRELARITAKLFSEATERMLVASQMLKAQNIIPCIDENCITKVQVYEAHHTSKLDEFAEAIGESVVKFSEDETTEWWGFTHDGVKYFTLRAKENRDGRNETDK